MMRKVQHTVLLVFFAFNLIAQKSIEIVDEENKPIVGSHVHFICKSATCYGDVITGVSDKEGKVNVPFTDSTLVCVSYVGYVSKTVLLASSESKIIQLEPDHHELEEFVITAQYNLNRSNKSVYSVQSIDQKEIAQKGINNVRELLNGDLSFKTNNGHVNESAVNLRGLSGEHVKIMVDGVPVEGRLNGNLDLSQINLGNVERVEIIKGPVSAIYGSNALGGVINIITNKRPKKNFSLFTDAYYESLGKYNLNSKIGWIKNKNTFNFSLGRNYFDGFSNTDTSRYKTWKPREQYLGGVSYYRRIKHLDFFYSLNGFTEKMTSRGERRAPYYISAFDTYYNTKRLVNKLLVKGRVKESGNINITLSNSLFSRSRNIYFKDLVTLEQFITESNTDQDTTKYNNSLLRAYYSTKKDDSEINYMLGTELKADQIIASRVIGRKQYTGNYALFGSLQYQPIKKLMIQPSVRYAYNTRYRAPLTPSLNILYSSSDKLQIRSSYAKGFRAPSLKELFLEFHFNETINLWGNEDLLAEQSDHFQFSLDYFLKIKEQKIKITPELFYTKINNRIQLVQSSDVDWTYMNIGRFKIQGASLTGSYRYRNIEFKPGASCIGRYDSMFDEKFNYQVDAISTLSWINDSSGVKISTSYKYTGKVNSYYQNEGGEIERGGIDAYSMLDFSVSKMMMKNNLVVVAGVKNLLNVQQVDLIGKLYGYSASKNATSLDVLMGRSCFIKLKYQL